MGSGARGAYLTSNRPDESAELPRDRRGHLWFRLAARHESTDAARQPEVGLPGDVTDDLREPFLAIQLWPANSREALIGPRRFREPPPDVRIPGLRESSAPHTRPTGLCRGHQAEKRHQFARMAEAREIPEFGDDAHRGNERDAPQRL